MVLAWLGLATVATFMARYTREVWGEQQILGQKIWFQVGSFRLRSPIVAAIGICRAIASLMAVCLHVSKRVQFPLVGDVLPCARTIAASSDHSLRRRESRGYFRMQENMQAKLVTDTAEIRFSTDMRSPRF